MKTLYFYIIVVLVVSAAIIIITEFTIYRGPSALIVPSRPSGINDIGTNSPSNMESTTPPLTIPTAGLVVEWLFENNAIDTSGNANNGETNGNISYQPGKIGYGINLDGTGIDRVPYSSNLNFPTTSFSISLWIKTTSPSLGWIVEHRRNNDGCYSGYSIEDAGNGKLVGRLRICAPATDTAANFDIVTNQINDGIWHNVVFVVDRANNMSKIYQDDVLVNSLAVSSLGNISQTSIGVDLGNTDSPNTPDTAHNMTLDQVRIYDRVLSPSDITALYDEPNGS